MKTCACGGKLYRHGQQMDGALRYRCKDCKKTMTVRDGKQSTLRGRPIQEDWRHA